MSDSKLNQFLARGTSAERVAFTPSPPTPASGPDPLYVWYETDTNNTYVWDGSVWQLVSGATTTTTPLADTSFLVSGGQVAWVANYQFIVSAAIYYIGGVRYTSAMQTITLSAADPTNDRIDVIAVDDTGTVVAIAGTPAAQPSEPAIDPGTQLTLSLVTVAAASTSPIGTSDEVVYKEDAGSPAEWNWISSDASIVLNSTNNPYEGTKDIEGTNVVAGAYAQGERGSGSIDPSTIDRVVFFLRSKATWNKNRGLQVSLRSSGVQVGGTVTIRYLNTYGFDSSITGSYQQIAIPIADFAISTGTTFNEIRVADFGGAIGFYLDAMSLQTGGGTTQTGNFLTQSQADALYAPLGPSFVTLASAATLPNERVLTAGSGITLTDGGPGSALTIAATGGGAAPVGAEYVTLATDGTLTAERVLTGTAHQITLTDGGAGSTVTISTPQDIDTTSTPQFGRVGLGTAADSSAVLTAAGQYYSPEATDTVSGGAATVDWNGGNEHYLSLTADATLTFSNPKGGGRYVLALQQDATGSRTVTWPVTVLWSGGTAPTLTTTPSKTDIFTFYYSAALSKYLGNYALNF